MEANLRSSSELTAFSYSVHASLSTSAVTGLLIWSPEEAAYFGVAGEEIRTKTINDTLGLALHKGTLQEVIDYYLERGGGGYFSFSEVKQLYAANLLDAARRLESVRGTIAVPEPIRPYCSSCGRQDDLHLVTVPIFGVDSPGRILVYCPSCRAEKATMIDVDVSLKDVDVALFVSLYANGKTTSAPQVAAEIVFGEAPLASTPRLAVHWLYKAKKEAPRNVLSA